MSRFYLNRDDVESEDEGYNESDSEVWAEDLITALEDGCVGRPACGMLASPDTSRDWPPSPARTGQKFKMPPLALEAPSDVAVKRAASTKFPVSVKAAANLRDAAKVREKSVRLEPDSLRTVAEESEAVPELPSMPSRRSIGSRSVRSSRTQGASDKTKRPPLLGMKTAPKKEEKKQKQATTNSRRLEMMGLRKTDEPSWTLWSAGGVFSGITKLRRETEKMADIMGFRDQTQRFRDNFIGRLVQKPWYDYLSLSMVVASAVLIGLDADLSARTADSGATLADVAAGSSVCCVTLVAAEVYFGVFFTLDLLLKLLGFRRMWQCFSDGWFMFDAVLVIMMDLFTFILPFAFSGGSPVSNLSGLRLLRLFRLLRMVRLLRAFPELMMIIEGLRAAISAVFWVVVLGLGIMYVFALAFTFQYHQGRMSDDECRALDPMDPDAICSYFGSVGKSFLTLFTQGSLVDQVTAATYTLRHNSMFYTFIWLCYILIAYFMLQNMLIGILSSAVASTTESKRQVYREQEAQEALKLLFIEMDQDGSGCISKEEFLSLKKSKEIQAALQKLSIQEKHLSTYAELFFQPDEVTGEISELNYETLLHCLTFILPKNKISKLDLQSYATFMQTKTASFIDDLESLETAIREVIQKKRGKPAKARVKLQDTPSTCSSSNTDEVLSRLHRLPSAALAAELKRRSVARMAREKKEIAYLERFAEA